jgi:hypothetical protein
VFFNADYRRARQNSDNWYVSLNRDLLGVTWGLSYVDTDLSDAECLSFSGYEDLCGTGLIASARKVF